MKFEIVRYDKLKHRGKLVSYLKKVEKRFEYIPFVFPISIIEMFSTFKNIFVVIEDKKIINLGYKNEIKSNVGFFFEKPKYDYDFLNDFDSAALLFPPKEEVDNIKCEEKVETSEAIIDISKVISLVGKEFKTLRGKLNRFRKENPNCIVEVFDKGKISRQELKSFYDEWFKSSEKRKSIDMSLYKGCLEFIYEVDGELDGIVVRNNAKIIGVAFFSISPLEKQSVGITSNGFCEFKGFNEFLAYERYRFVYERYKIKFMNVGSANSERIINMKKKFCFFREKLLILVLKGNDLRDKDFWHDDCVDPDDFGL